MAFWWMPFGFSKQIQGEMHKLRRTLDSGLMTVGEMKMYWLFELIDFYSWISKPNDMVLTYTRSMDFWNIRASFLVHAPPLPMECANENLRGAAK